MQGNERLQELKQREDTARLGGGRQGIEKEHAKGKLTARERLDQLFDSGTFCEVGLLAKHRCEDFADKMLAGDGVVTGFGFVNERPVYAFSQDATVMGGSLGARHGEKICTIMDMATRARAPIVGINDSAGARVQEGSESLAAYGQIFFGNVAGSGVIPQISAIMGNCAGGAVYSPAITDFIFMVEKTSYMFITGPRVIKAVTGESTDMESLGGAKTHSSISGNCDFSAPDDAECIAQIRRLIDFIPANCYTAPPVVPYPGEDTPDMELLSMVPDNPKKSYDMKDIVYRLVDHEDFMEVKPGFASNIICGFGRIGGQTAGVVANQPRVLAGTLDSNASDKAARFIRFCDAFNIPLISLVDVPGYLPGLKHEYSGIIRHGAKMIFAYSEATVPKLTIIVRKAYGGAFQAMCSKQLGADYVWAWPTAEVAVMGAEGAAEIIFAKEIQNSEDPETMKAVKVEEYRRKFYNPYDAAGRMHLDAVIDPSLTRHYLKTGLKTLIQKKQSPLPRKHSNIPL
ncbi:MAG: acyl-CoA carboxylase subunit beta [Desulfobacteraceae bacterium]